MAGSTLKAAATAARAVRAVKKATSSATSAASSATSASESLLARARTLPIQKSIDIAVPIDVVWDEWMRFEHVPEGTHRVTGIERENGHLVGRLEGPKFSAKWKAEIVDERIDESFGWHSVAGSDCSGLLTFHELSDRLTRLELHLDVIPGGVSDAFALMSRIADRRAEAELRRFKAEVEAIDPDDYPPPPEHDDVDGDVEEEE